jgi:hypothetical protein
MGIKQKFCKKNELRFFPFTWIDVKVIGEPVDDI